MNTQKSSMIISIIALIISIIALVLVLLMCNCCRQHCCKSHQDQSHQDRPCQQQPAAEQASAGDASLELVYTGQDEEPADQIVIQDKATKAKAPTAPFIDLGLPSGIKWRALNEDCGLVTYDDAVERFGKQLPTQKQYNELYEKCEWKELKEGGYKVIGPNGNFILFPLTGFINCTGEFRGEKEFGDYWTATAKDGSEAYRVVFNSKAGVKIVPHTRCYQRAIRLIEK